MKPDLVLCPAPERTFFNGHALFATAAPGDIRDGTTKLGEARLTSYGAGAAVLLDAGGKLLAGPVDFDGAELLATAIVEGNPRALTEPAAALRLAMAYLALIDGTSALLGGKAHG